MAIKKIVMNLKVIKTLFKSRGGHSKTEHAKHESQTKKHEYYQWKSTKHDNTQSKSMMHNFFLQKHDKTQKVSNKHN